MLRKLQITSAMLCACLTPLLGHATESNPYECYFDLSDAEHSVRSVVLTPEVYACMHHDNYRDLAVINAEQQVIPMRVLSLRTESDTQRNTQALSFYQEPSSASFRTGDQVERLTRLTGVVSSHKLDQQWQNVNSQYTSILIEQGDDDIWLDKIAIKLKPNVQPVVATIIIESSNDLQDWTTVLPPHALYRLENQSSSNHRYSMENSSAELLNTEFELTRSSNNRYFRIAVLSNQERFIDVIESIEGEHLTTTYTKPELQWLTIDDPVRLESGNAWTLSIDHLLPVTNMRLTPQANVVFYQGRVYAKPHTNPIPDPVRSERQIREEGKQKLKDALKSSVKGYTRPAEGEIQWRYAGSFTNYTMATESGTISSLESRLSLSKTDLLKIEFTQPVDIKPGQLPTIELGWQPVQLEFIAQGNGPFQLVAGRDKIAQRVAYPSTFADESAETVSIKKRLQPSEISTTQADAAVEDDSTSKRNEIILWVVLIFGVVLLGMMAFQLSKSMNSADKE